jgi:hypothetical protein
MQRPLLLPDFNQDEKCEQIIVKLPYLNLIQIRFWGFFVSIYGYMGRDTYEFL